MKKFQFRLQNLLDLKVKKLDEKLVELSKILNLIFEEKQKIEELARQKLEINLQFEKACEKNLMLDVSKLLNLKNFLPKIDENIRNLKQKIDDMEKVLDIKQFEVNEAFKEKKMLEKLKEKHKKNFYKEFELNEAKELDDLTSARFNLQMKY